MVNQAKCYCEKCFSALANIYTDACPNIIRCPRGLMVRREPPKLKTAGSSPAGDAFFFGYNFILLIYFTSFYINNYASLT